MERVPRPNLPTDQATALVYLLTRRKRGPLTSRSTRVTDLYSLMDQPKVPPHNQTDNTVRVWSQCENSCRSPSIVNPENDASQIKSLNKLLQDLSLFDQREIVAVCGF